MIVGHVNMLNIALVILPVSRDSLFQKIFSIPFEQGLVYHRILARSIIFFVTLHGLSWYGYWIYHEITNTVCDVAFCSISSALSIQAITGLISWILLMILASFALEFIRRKYFELFYVTHHIFILFIIMAVFHSLLAQEVLEDGWNQDLLIYYLIPGVSLYIIDRILRIYRTLKANSEIFSLENIQGGLTCIQVGLDVKFKAGQYYFLNCPQVSKFQWHPYSVASGDEDDKLTFYIKSMGKGTWSDRLNILAKNSDNPENSSNAFQLTFQNVITLKLDGPYGTDYLKHKKKEKHFCFTAGGIGITPIVSVIRTLVIDPPKPRVHSLQLLWVVKSTDELLCFADFLKELSLCGDYYDSFTLSLKIFVTRKGKELGKVEYIPKAKPETFIPYDIQQPTEESLLIQGDTIKSFSSVKSQELNQACEIEFESGRPNILKEVSEMHHLVSQKYPQASKINLLCCGPPGFEIPVAIACKSLSSKSNTITFDYTCQTFML